MTFRSRFTSQATSGMVEPPTYDEGMGEEDVVPLGKLRRRRKPSAAISYDPGHGIRVAGENCPRQAAPAAAWLKASGGWVRLYKAIPVKTRPFVADFVAELRRP